MEKLIKFINEKANNKFLDFKVSEILFDKARQFLTIKFSYKKDRSGVTDEEREELEELIEAFLVENLNQKINFEVKTKKALLDEDVVRELTYKFILNNYTSINNLSKNDIVVTKNNEHYNIEIEFDKVHYDFLESKNFNSMLVEYLSSSYFETFEVFIKEKYDTSKQAYLEEYRSKIESTFVVVEDKPKFAKIVKQEPIIGDEITQQALLVESVKQPVSGIAVVGVIRFITKRSFISKKQKDDNGNFIEKQYYSFTLTHDNKSLQCVMFLNSNDLEKFESINEGETVICFGDTETFNDRFNMKVKRIGLCAIEEEKEPEVELKKENKNYIFVKPEPYIMLEQSNLFDVAHETNEFLRSNTVVVFDLETTGLDATVNEIIEIGAVKIENGKITETFSSLIKPKAQISDEITNITGITNEMVADCYSIDQVLPDFYKFTRNSVLSAYNISFDYNFLAVVSKRLGYDFNNRQIDSMVLARTKLAGLKNYKLKTVATALNIPLENAHRAVNDAVATAEVFIKLSDGLK